MKSFRSLLQVLNKEAKLQDKLLVMLVEERSKIVHLQREELEKLSEKKELLLLELGDLKLDRNQIIQAIVEEFKPETNKPKLSDIALCCDDKSLSSELISKGQSLKELVIKVDELNKDNGILLKQSLGLLSTTISLMTARPIVNNASYGRNAKVAAEGEDDMTVISSFNRAV